MKHDRLLQFGIIGAVVAALCCFTPILVVLLAAVGAGWVLGYLDFVLIPALFLFLALTVYAVWRRPAPIATDSTTEEQVTYEQL